MSPREKSSDKITRPNGELDMAIQFVKGVGPKLAERFKTLGIETVGDLLWHVPSIYQDQRVATPLRDVRAGKVWTVRGIVTSFSIET